MPVIVNEVRVPLGAGEDEAVELALRRLGLGHGELAGAGIAKCSVDARHRSRLSLVYAVELDLRCDEAAAVARAGSPQVRLRVPAPYAPPMGEEALSSRPVIAGFGPAGMFAGLLLARRGYRPLIVERGAPVEERVRAVEGFFASGAFDPDSNVQFGEGGAGTFSDGKLTTRIGDARCETVLREFAAAGAPASILRAAKPHIGTDHLRAVVRAFRRSIEELGGEVRFHTRLEALRVEGGRLRAVRAGGEEIPARALVLAVGHSARDTFEMLLQSGVALEPKPFSAGVRIEHPQRDIDRALYGALAGHPALPPGEYQLSLRKGGRAVYTFCMCPGGSVVAAASEEGGVVTNGMSLYRRDGENANAALVVSVSPADFGPGALAGVAFQRRLERAAFRAGGGGFRAPAQSAGAFLGRPESGPRVAPTYPRGVEEADLAALFPAELSELLRDGLRAFGRRLRGFDAPGALLTGVETRTSSPARIPRGETGEAPGVAGLYPAGEGAGYAGGIMSAAVDGLRAAEAVMARYRPAVPGA